MIENLSPSFPSGFDVLSGNEGTHLHPPVAVTAGRLLREAREAAGLRLETLAGALKVPVKKLQALEMGQHELLLDMVFVRALACSVCRNLQIDAGPVLALLPHTGRSSFSTAPAALEASFNPYQPAMKTSGWASVSTPAALAGLLLVIGAGVLLLLPSMRETLASSRLAGKATDMFLQAFDTLRVPVPTAESTADTSTDAPVPGFSEVTGPKALTSLPLVATPNAGEPASTPFATLTPTREDKSASTPDAALTAQTLARNAASAGLKSTPDTAVGNPLVSFSAVAQPSWVKVTDAKGAVVLKRTISPGEQVSAAGTPPLVVVVGRADAMRVLVRGVAFDLGAYSKENIARFEVK